MMEGDVTHIHTHSQSGTDLENIDHRFTLTSSESSQPAPQRCSLPGPVETALSPESQSDLQHRISLFIPGGNITDLTSKV